MKFYIKATSEKGKEVTKGGQNFIEIEITTEHESKRQVYGKLYLSEEKDGRAVHAEVSHVLTYASVVDGRECEETEIDRVTFEI